MSRYYGYGQTTQFSADFKSKVALSAIRGYGTLAELASRYQIYPNMIAKWKREALAGMKHTFAKPQQRQQLDREAEIKTLQAKVGELIVEWDFLAEAFDR